MNSTNSNAIVRAVAYCYIGFLCLAYIVVIAHTPITLLPDSPFDDALFVALGRSLANGNWLGPFNEVTLVKGPGYPIFLALGHWLGLSSALARGLFHCVAVVAF